MSRPLYVEVQCPLINLNRLLPSALLVRESSSDNLFTFFLLSLSTSQRLEVNVLVPKKIVRKEGKDLLQKSCNLFLLSFLLPTLLLTFFGCGCIFFLLVGGLISILFFTFFSSPLLHFPSLLQY